jgi:hypothetical protein
MYLPSSEGSISFLTSKVEFDWLWRFDGVLQSQD